MTRVPTPRTADENQPPGPPSADPCEPPATTRSRSTRRAFTLIEALILAAVLHGVLALAVPGFAYMRRQARMSQNSIQLGSIRHGMEAYSLSSKTGGRDGWYPGFDGRTGMTIPIDDVIPAAQLAASADVPGYAAEASENVRPGEMNVAPARGFLVRVFAELAAGDFVAAGRPDHFINPADPLKTAFVPGVSGPLSRFTAANISYTTLDLGKNDGGVFPYKSGWREAADGKTVLLADRAVGNGGDPGTRSSVWTQPGSGDWSGWAALNDGSTVWTLNPAHAAYRDARFGGIGFAPGRFGSIFTRGLKLVGTPPVISADSGVLYDEADSGTDPNAF